MAMVAGPPSRDLTADELTRAAFTGLVFKHFNPRRVRIPRFSDEVLLRLQMPVMLVVGGRDVMLDSRGSAALLRRNVPNADIRFLPEARHVLPDQSAAIGAFLDTHSDPPASPASRSPRH